MTTPIKEILINGIVEEIDLAKEKITKHIRKMGSDDFESSREFISSKDTCKLLGISKPTLFCKRRLSNVRRKQSHCD